MRHGTESCCKLDSTMFTVATQPETAGMTCLSQPPTDGRKVDEHNDWECDLKHRNALCQWCTVPEKLNNSPSGIMTKIIRGCFLNVLKWSTDLHVPIVPYQQLPCNKQFHASIPTNARRHSSCTSRYAFSKSVRPYIAPNHVLKSLDSQLYTSMMGTQKKIKSRVCVLGLFFHHLMSSKKQMGLFGKLLVCELQVSSSTAKDPSCGRKFPSLEEPTELNGTQKGTKSAGNHERFPLNPCMYTIHIHVYIYIPAIPHTGQGFHAWIVRRTEGIWVLSAMF